MPILPYKGVMPRIATDTFIAPSAVVVGDVTIAAGASVWFGAVIRGDVAPIRIGAGSNVQDTCVLHADEDLPCEIGENCTLGHGAIVHGARIADHVLIGMHATVLNGAEIGAECILAAGTLVPEGKHIPPGQLVIGVPGKAARPITEAERERIRTGAEHYREYAREYAAVVRGAAENAAEEAGG
jgi:carbonic anhydrase/acetyltransferase-like protein (isoleucine patch superfamily)